MQMRTENRQVAAAHSYIEYKLLLFRLCILHLRLYLHRPNMNFHCLRSHHMQLKNIVLNLHHELVPTDLVAMQDTFGRRVSLHCIVNATCL